MKKQKKVTAKKKTVQTRQKKTQPQKHPKIKIQKIAPVVAVSITSESPPISQVKHRRKRGTNVTRMYFTQETEDAIILYNSYEDLEVREQIFRDKILYPFQKLVENIFNTFKFSYFETGPQDVQKECLTHLVANMHKFDPTRVSKTDPTKKTKAYSYFSMIVKNYLILLNNTNYKKFKQNVEISDDRDENTIQLQQDDKYYAQQEMSDFIRLIIEFWEKNVNKIFSKQRDLNIANAVVELMRSCKNISMFNKKALYLYIREMAMCKTQQITKILNRMKIYHDKMKYSYQNNGVVDTETLP